jgi:hypothetical protein
MSVAPFGLAYVKSGWDQIGLEVGVERVDPRCVGVRGDETDVAIRPDQDDARMRAVADVDDADPLVAETGQVLALGDGQEQVMVSSRQR